MDISELNSLPSITFLKFFANVVERFPACAKHLEENRPYQSLEGLLKSTCQYLDGLPQNDVETILGLHPDLAGRIADDSELTAESQNEQRAAGLRTMSAAETDELRDLNSQYKTKFGFPFIICARENKTDAILNGLRMRLNNEIREEWKTAMEEVKKITSYRIKSLVRTS